MTLICISYCYTYNMSSKDKTNGCIVCEIEIQKIIKK